jgi:predicted transcriptional regulator
MQISHRRSNLEIISDILRLKQASKTKIMYSSNMSYTQLEKYLQLLLERGFLQCTVKPNPGVIYHVTEKGEKLLKGIESVLELLDKSECGPPLDKLD